LPRAPVLPNEAIPLLSRTHPRSCFQLIAEPRIAFIQAPIRHPKTIFHAFTQQNRMSSPQTSQKTHNPNPTNKIKLSQKWFLVMVNPVQLNQENKTREGPATSRA
jgi:ribonuclease D